MEKVRVGIIGVGNMGSGHFQSIMEGKVPDLEVTAVADRRPERLDFALAKYKEYTEGGKTSNGTFATFAEGSELISSGLCDAVLICIPHYFHPSMAIDAMKHNLHVMCEKPAGVYTLQVREMMAEADRHPDLVFGMMFNQRTNCVYRKMREIIKSGELGEIRRTNWIITDWYRPQFYYDSGDWRATWSGEGGGVLLNQCPHQLDLWQWICGMPVSIHSHMKFGKWHDIEVEDDVTVYCEYANGATGTFITSTGDAPGTNRFEIVCDGGTLICDKKALTLRKLEMPIDEFSRINTKVFGRPKSEDITVETDGEHLQHVGVLRAFGGAILRGEPLVADGREGINGLTISNAIHLSAWLGKEVTVPFDEKLYYDELMKRVAVSRRKEATSGATGDTEGTY
ncbi:MAG: Gfo/Idh/MocA family oxidoreductase [Clostridia bacterium]|nr:Gfo/Idh/MocA family oxidoreductase [Clostridia bacterium]